MKTLDWLKAKMSMLCHLRHRTRTLLFSVLLLLPVHVLMSEEAGLQPDLSHNLVTQIYQPLHTVFADTATQWAIDSADLCDRRPSSSAYKMQFRFAKLVELYAAVEFYRLGPLLENNLQNRIFYWPDTRNVGQRQLRSLVTLANTQPLTVSALAGKSVAIQGFPALERLLFKSDYLPLELTPQCRLIPLIINNIALMAAELDAEWRSDSEFVKSLLEPHAGSSYFRNIQEIERSVFTQAKVGLDVLLEGKLRPFLSNDPEIMPKTPLWTSQRTISMLSGNITGLRELLLDSGLLSGTRFDDEFRIEFDYIDHVLLELQPLRHYVEPDGKLKPEVKVLMHKLAAVVAGLRFTLTKEVSSDLGISTGFNSEDGD